LDVADNCRRSRGGEKRARGEAAENSPFINAHVDDPRRPAFLRDLLLFSFFASA